MAEYIEREALRAKAVYMHGFGKNKYVPLRAIEEALAADVAPVVHGRWVDNIDENGLRRNAWRKCSACGGLNFSKKPPYCPNCGAKTDGKSNVPRTEGE